MSDAVASDPPFVASVAANVRLRLPLPREASPEREASLPAFEIGPVSGAHVTLRAGWSGELGVVRIACASAPARGFAPGVEDLVFGRATQIARAVLPNVTRLDAGPARATPTGFEQRFEGEASIDRSATPLVGRHLLAFADGGAEAVVCSIACLERARGACAASVDGARLDGDLAPPPPPSLAVRALFAGVEHPTASLSALALVAIALTAVLLARRPRSVRSRFG